MSEYEFETANAVEGVFTGRPLEYRKAVCRQAAGWRYAGWIPTAQTKGVMTAIDLVFEQETGERDEAGAD